jgi:hypothetical protein
MRVGLALLLLVIACGGSPKPATTPAPAPVADPAPPPPAPPSSLEEMAIRFVTAVAARDRATLATMLFDRVACELLARDGKLTMGTVDDCADEMTRANEQGLAGYQQSDAADFGRGRALSLPRVALTRRRGPGLLRRARSGARLGP